MPAPTECDAYQRTAKETRAIKTRRRHAIELVDKVREVVQDLELRLDTKRWEPGSDKWQEVATMVGKRRYQRVLDDLEGLIVARLMELSKCILAGTAYTIRKHIAKALQVRSKAIKVSIERYSSAASSMIPPRTHVLWDEVAEYAFLRIAPRGTA
ncbi:hypothetical protein B0H17DRAFT_938665 [Mycena rosella]|uniref:Uncharacterized protein n=1 Tax=Mycena rosella TaxID=1033263 RepID=A0AAD7DCM9_MYCRO|nr:hypothetical protein B0H17DRAFT_938665 [Mycena rosella]